MSRVYLALTITLLIGWAPWARSSTTFTSNTPVGNWSSAASWTPGGGPPTAFDDAIIAAGNDIIVDTAGCVCKSLTIGNGSVGSAQITYNLGGILTVSGTVQVGSGS